MFRTRKLFAIYLQQAANRNCYAGNFKNTTALVDEYQDYGSSSRMIVSQSLCGKLPERKFYKEQTAFCNYQASAQCIRHLMHLMILFI